MGLNATVYCGCKVPRRLRGRRDEIVDECPHPGGELAQEWISNWYGVGQFREQIDEVGREKFLVLHKLLPRANGGDVSPRKAAMALRDLDLFEKLDIGWRYIAVDEERDDRLHLTSTGAAGERWFFEPNWRCGIVGHEFVILWDLKLTTYSPSDPVTREMFRATRFTQQRRGELVRLTSPDGQSIDSPWAYARYRETDEKCPTDFPRRIAIARRWIAQSDFADIVGRLRRILSVSVESNQPVMW